MARVFLTRALVGSGGGTPDRRPVSLTPRSVRSTTAWGSNPYGLFERMFDARIVGMPALARPETIADAAGRLAEMDQLPRGIRLAAAHVLREAAAGLRRGQPLPTRLHWAVGEFVTAIEASTGRHDGDEVEFP